VQRDERGRAGGVDRDGGAGEAEEIGEPPGDDGGGGAGEQVPFDALAGAAHQVRVVLAGVADEDAGLRAGQRSRVDAGAFDGLPGRLQQQPLLGVHGEGLTRGDAEEPGVEVGDVVQEAAGGGVRGARPVGIGVAQRVEVPAAVFREAGDGVGARGDQVPQVLRRPDAAGQPAPHADDRDGLLLGFLDRLQAPARLVQIGRDPPEVLAQRLLVGHVSATSLFSSEVRTPGTSARRSGIKVRLWDPFWAYNP
jgi:hypothetical protein